MPKVTSDLIKKIAMAAAFLILLFFSYTSQLMAPLSRRIEWTQKGIDELTIKIGDADSQIRRVSAVREEAIKAEEVLAHFGEMIPGGSPVAWFPSKTANFFSRFGLERASTRVANLPNGVRLGPAIAGFDRLFWTVDFNAAGFIDLGMALAALENEEPLVVLRSIRIESGAPDVERQQVTLGVSNIVRSQVP